MNKYCPKCKTTKSLDEFNTDKTRKNGKCIYCRSCASISNRKSYSRRRIEVALRNKENRVGLSRYKNNYYHSNPLYKIACNIRTTLRQRIKGKNNSTKALDLLGCSVEDFKTWIESQFEPGMTWGNWNLHGWHLDHIIPLSAVNLKDPKQLRVVCNWFNLRPYWATDNLSKHDKM